MNYAVIGPETSPNHYNYMLERIASRFEEDGYTLVTQGRVGFEEAAVRGIDLSHNKTIIPGNRWYSKPCKRCMDIAWNETGPKWKRYNYEDKIKAAYVVQTLLGINLNTPAKFLITYSEDEYTQEDVYLATRVAREYSILTFDLAQMSFQKIWEEVQEL